jgi:hypothetical protein
MLPGPEDYVRRIMARAAHAKIKLGEFSLSELIAIENNVASPRVRIPGFTGIGTSIEDNGVHVAFNDRESVCPGMAAVATLGVPMRAIIPRIMGRAHLDSGS